MGIRDLNSFIKQNVPEAAKIINYSDLNHNSNKKKVAIDISIFLYKFKYNNKNIYEHFLNQINRLSIHNIIPIYIFDGIPPKEKLEILNNRKERKTENKEKINNISKEISEYEAKISNLSSKNGKSLEELVLIQDYKKKINNLKFSVSKLDNKIIHITKDDIKNVKYFLDLLNVKYIVANGEADLLCSYLFKKNYVDMVLSEDMDILVSGGDILLRDFNINSNKITKYDVNIILNKLNFTKEDWINFCILCGCDYVKRIYGVGPKFILKYLKTDGDILNVIKTIFDKKNKLIGITYDEYKEKFIKAKEIFLNNNINLGEKVIQKINTSCLNENLFDNQIENIKVFLRKNTKFSDLQIKNKIKNMYNID